MRRHSAGRRRISFGPGLSPGVTWILAIEVAAFLLLMFIPEASRNEVKYWGELTGASLLQGHVWKLASTILFNAPLALFLHVLMLVMFVPILEHTWGTKRFLKFFAVTSLVGNAVGALIGAALGGGYAVMPIIGLGPFILASIVAYGVIFANQPVQFFGVIPMKAKVLAIGIAVVTFIALLFNRDWPRGAAEFSAMGLAFVLTSGIWAPNVWWLKFRRWKLRRRYTVLDGGQKGPPGGKKPPQQRPDQRWMN
jgi:membrane associated rhomboid family serine protease